MNTSSVTIEELLQSTSRTFALSIPLLPHPLDHKVTLAYLIFRIADTLEDADHLDPATRQLGLQTFCQLLDDMSDQSVREWSQEWTAKRPSDNADYNRLLRETPQVMSAVRELNASARDAIVHHAQRSARGMAEFLDRADEAGHLSLSSLHDLRRYCYFVAGIVGELITDLFVSEWDNLAEITLRDNAAAFGEGLQLVNILKDSTDDAKCGRAYLPMNVPIDEVYTLAFDDLEKAEDYVETLRTAGAPGGYIAFCDAPVQLAKATLETVRVHGPGSKVPRAETFALLHDVMQRAGLRDDFPTPRKPSPNQDT